MTVPQVYKPKFRFQDLIGIAVSSTYTYLIYITNTPLGSEAQADAVIFFTWLLFVLSLLLATVRDHMLVYRTRAERTTFVIATLETLVLVQIVLLFLFGQYVLFLLRSFAAAVGYARYKYAVKRVTEAAQAAHARRAALRVDSVAKEDRR